MLCRSRKKGNKSSGNFSLFQCLSETTKNRKKTHRERPDFPDVFTKAQEADIDLLKTTANIIPLSSNQPTTTSVIPEIRPQTVPVISPSQSVSSTSSVIKTKPIDVPTVKNKSELELKSLSLEAKHPSEKKDLFKAIFDSDDEETSIESKSNDVTEVALQPTIPVHEFLPKPAAILNVLRNSSPPRGIFSNMFKTNTESKVTNIESKVSGNEPLAKSVLAEKSNISVPSTPPTLLYGPSLPGNSLVPVIPTPESTSTNSKGKSSFVHDEWIEKSQMDEKKKDKKKHKKVKKHKKEKSKKKKKNKDKSR